MNIVRIATRKSALALWQAEFVKSELERLHQGIDVVLVPMVSKGDKILDVPLSKVGGKGLFVKELETALLNDEADIAVHSMKDVPMDFPPGLGLSVICEREDPRDAWVSSTYTNLDALPANGVIGTSSLRRQSQLLSLRRDVEIRFLRGNVNTRLAKLDAGDYDAIILAAAGLKRLGMEDRITSYLSPEVSLPAAGQGAVGIESRVGDTRITDLLAPLQHEKTAQCVEAERAMNKELKGGCQVPIGGYAIHQNDGLWLRGLVADPDTGEVIFRETRGPVAEREKLGVDLAQSLLRGGADKILAKVYGTLE